MDTYIYIYIFTTFELYLLDWGLYQVTGKLKDKQSM